MQCAQTGLFFGCCRNACVPVFPISNGNRGSYSVWPCVPGEPSFDSRSDTSYVLEVMFNAQMPRERSPITAKYTFDTASSRLLELSLYGWRTGTKLGPLSSSNGAGLRLVTISRNSLTVYNTTMYRYCNENIAWSRACTNVIRKF